MKAKRKGKIKMVKIALDAGHGIHTPGKRSPDDEREWTFNNKVLLVCMEKLKTYTDVEILRVDDPTGKTDVSLQIRTNKANAWKADAYVSIHHNANTAKWGPWGGVETFTMDHSNANPKSVALAKAVHPGIVSAMGLRDRGLKKKNLHVLRETNMPAILTEGGFMDSTSDIHALRSDAKLKEQGEAIAAGIVAYFRLKGGVSTSTKPLPVKNEVISLSEVKDAKPSTSLAKDVARGVGLGITDGTFLHRTATREEVIAMIVRVYEKLSK